jgi:hypothetical protein
MPQGRNHPSKLILVRAKRSGGGNKTPRVFWDFQIAGRSVLELMGWGSADLVTPLGWGTRSSQLSALDELRRRKQPVLPSGRSLLYVCPECGDIGCGAIAARILRKRDQISWSDFAHEDGSSTSPIEAAELYFHPTEYWSALEVGASDPTD